MSAGGPWEERPSLDAQLLERRVVRLWGPLDDATVARACAEMMALDATGDGAVQLYVGSSGGPLHSAMSLIDTIDLLGVPVHVTCLGRAEGAAVGVVAAGARRVAAPHAQFHSDRAGSVSERERQPVGRLGRATPGRAGAVREAVGSGHRPAGRTRRGRPLYRALARGRRCAPLRPGGRDLDAEGGAGRATVI